MPTNDDTPVTAQQAEAILQQLARAVAPSSAEPLAPTWESPDEARVERYGASLDELEVDGRGASPFEWTEQTMEGILESLPDAMVIVNRRGHIVQTNAQTERMFGYRREELAGRAIELLVPERFRTGHVAHRDGFFADPHSRPMGVGLELFGRHKNGKEVPVEISLSPLRIGTDVHVISTIRDISDRRRAEADLRKAEIRYRTLVEELPAVTFMAALDGSISELYVSPQIETLLGFSQQEWLENPVLWHEQLHPEDRTRWNVEFAQTCAMGEHFRSVYRFLARDGRVVWVHGEAKVVRDHEGRPLFMQGVAFDITERKQAEDTLRNARDELEVKVRQRTAQIEASLDEKEILLKEIHHRVKNNLQLVSSLLRLQSGGIEDPATLEVFKASQDRIKAMARIHEELYGAKDLARIDFGQYARSLATGLVHSFGGGVTIAIDIEEVHFGIDTAIPCGLIINELVSNCLKYAFPDGKPGKIRIRVVRDQEDRYTLCIHDDGIGFPEGVDFRRTKSLGLRLVSSLVNQLRGTIELHREAGTQFVIQFVCH